MRLCATGLRDIIILIIHRIFLKVTAMPRDTVYFLAAELIDVTVQLFVPKTRAVSLLGYSIYVIILRPIETLTYKT